MRKNAIRIAIAVISIADIGFLLFTLSNFPAISSEERPLRISFCIFFLLGNIFYFFRYKALFINNK
ncbi:hypothetical protein J2T14_005216 [Paenibacillus harenae]|nr:hypothetical protein [Paenibacillus harenae]